MTHTPSPGAGSASYDWLCAVMDTALTHAHNRGAGITAKYLASYVSTAIRERRAGRCGGEGDGGRMSDDRLPCPFCGSTRLSFERSDGPTDDEGWIFCRGCDTVGPTALGVGAVNAAWNRRAQPEGAATTTGADITEAMVKAAAITLIEQMCQATGSTTHRWEAASEKERQEFLGPVRAALAAALKARTG